ncbi:MAG: WSD1 family O-acyltransferase [Chromatiales bacterium]|nr:WSD1 family O-acyltransferase [Chromatiales bacterium]
MSDIAIIRRRWGGRVNDVMLAAVAGALGRYLRVRGEMRPGLKARLAVPVNLRPYQEEIRLGNEFAVIFVELPLGCGLIRWCGWRWCGRAWSRVKSSPEAVANQALIRMVGRLPGWLERWVLRLFGTKATAVMTNVPGPEEALYLAGAPVARGLAWVPQITGVGIGFCVLSYAGTVTFGVTTDSGVVADPGELVAGLELEIADLVARAGLLAA